MGILDYLRRHARHICLIFVLGYSLVYAFAFVQLHFVEHPYHSSSRWMLETFKDGVRILGPHWDDRLPASVPEHPRNPSRVFESEGREYELPLYEPDTKFKMDMVLRRMSGADYIVFATPRMADSIPRIPDEYPQTSALLRMLWGEKLGFKLIKTFKNRPSFLGITFNDDLADESFSVYDHPKVTIFENVDHLSMEELRDRIANVSEYGALPTMNEMLLMDEGGWVAKPPSPLEGKVIPFVCAFTFIQLIAFAFWGVFGARLGFLRDRGFGLSPLLGLVFASGISWVLAACGIAPVNKMSGYLVVGVMACVAIVLFVTKPESRRKLIEAWRAHGLRAEIGFVAGLLVVSVVLLADPQFLALSQQVDGSYLQYFFRNETIPPVDLLNPSQAMQGFYFDRFVLGWFLKGIGVSGVLGIQVAMLLLGGVFGAAVYSVAASLIARTGLAMSVSLVTAIPVIVAVLVAREYRESVPGLVADQLSPDQKKLVQWLSQSIKGTPVVIDSCVQHYSSGLARVAGLAAYQQLAGVDSSQSPVEASLCALQDIQGIFDFMMKYGASLYVLTGTSDAGTGEVTAVAGAFEARPDLFAKLYDTAGLKVFAPAFSDLYRIALTTSK